MGRPAFRFVAEAEPFQADDQFWRDVEASERLGSPLEADRFIRSLCHARAMEAAHDKGEQADLPSIAVHEAAMVRQVSERGYRVLSTERGPLQLL